MEEKVRCEVCNREFKSKEALEMHNSAKHSSSKTQEKSEKKVSKVNYKKIRNWGIFIVVLGLLVWEIFVLVQSGTPSGEDFSRAVPILPNRDHISVGSASLVEYNSNPPTSGPHYGTPARPGFRENIIEDGYLIHSIEHGLVWVSYHPRIGEEAEKLRGVTGPFIVITQREANDEDIAVASWGRLDSFNLEDGTIDADDLQRINDFVLRYANKGPESIPAGQHGGI